MRNTLDDYQNEPSKHAEDHPSKSIDLSKNSQSSPHDQSSYPGKLPLSRRSRRNSQDLYKKPGQPQASQNFQQTPNKNPANTSPYSVHPGMLDGDAGSTQRTQSIQNNQSAPVLQVSRGSQSSSQKALKRSARAAGQKPALNEKPQPGKKQAAVQKKNQGQINSRIQKNSPVWDASEADFMSTVYQMDPMSKESMNQEEAARILQSLDPKQVVALADSNLSDAEFWKMISKMRSPSIWLYRDPFSFEMWKQWTIWLPAFVMAFYTIAGELFRDYPSWNFSWLISQWDILLVRLFMLVMLFMANAFTFQGLYVLLDQGKKVLRPPVWMQKARRKRMGFSSKNKEIDPENELEKRKEGTFLYDFKQAFAAYPAFFFFVILFIAFVPDLLVSLPGKMMGDTYDQLKQMIGATPGFNSHHPVVHTLFMGFFVKLGIFIGNPALGAVLYTLFQAMILQICLAQVLAYLYKEGYRRSVWLGVLIYYISSPILFSYMTLWTKDVLYAAFFVLFYLAWYQVLYGFREKTRPADWYMVLFLSAFMMVVLRSEGLYIIAISAVAGIFFGKLRTASASLLAFAVGVSVLLSFVFYPMLSVEIKNERRESLSIPFQQTARFLRDSEAPMTQEQRSAIEAVLDIRQIPLVYNPLKSDAVKSTYHGTDEDLGPYFKAWWEMFLADPEVYFMATLEAYYEYLDPLAIITNDYNYAWSAQMAGDIRDQLGIDLETFSYLKPAQAGTEAFFAFLNSLPIYSAYMHPAFYMWLALGLILFIFHKKRYHLLLLTLPMAVNILVIFASPVNGYYGRYQFPMMLYLPALLFMIMRLESMQLPGLRRKKQLHKKSGKAA